MTRNQLALLLVASLAITLPRFVWTQYTYATCATEFNWMFNANHQSPCLIAAYLYGPCIDDPQRSYVSNLPPGSSYPPPGEGGMATVCQCNTVFYSLVQACALCQHGVVLPWKSFYSQCPKDNPTTYPFRTPAGTTVPQWAYLDVDMASGFNVSAAMKIALPDSNPQGSTSIGPSTSISSISSPTGTAPPTHHSNVGPIVGGVVGGIGGAVVIALLIFLLRRRARNDGKLISGDAARLDVGPSGYAPSGDNDNSRVTEKLSQPEVPVMNLNVYSLATNTGHNSATARLYNPDDPDTFPTKGDEALVLTAMTAAQAQAPSYHPHPPEVPPARYSGAPEI